MCLWLLIRTSRTSKDIKGHYLALFDIILSRKDVFRRCWDYCDIKSWAFTFWEYFSPCNWSPSGKQLHAWHLYFLTSNRNTFNKSGRHFGSTMDRGYGHWSQASIKKLKSTIYFVNLHRHTIRTPHAFHYTWRHTTNTIIISLITFANPQTIVL